MADGWHCFGFTILQALGPPGSSDGPVGSLGDGCPCSLHLADKERTARESLARIVSLHRTGAQISPTPQAVLLKN